MTPRRNRFYLDKARGKIMGVCAGVADYTGVDVTVVRVGLVLLTVATGGMGGFGLLAYLLVGWLADDRPRAFDEEAPGDRRFWQKVRARPGHSIRDVRASFREVDRRLADVEAHLTSQNRRLADEIEALR